MIEDMLKSDFQLWKLKRFVKDPNEIKKIEDIFHFNIKLLKDLYITLLSTSTYPNLTWLDFVNYIKSCGILDEKMPLSTIDRLFIAINLEGEVKT